MKLSTKVLMGLVLGVLFGIAAPAYTIYIKPVGDIFLRSIKMVIPMLIYLTIVNGITSVGDNKSLGKLGLKATIAYMCTTFFAVCFGICMALIMRPGDGVHVTFGDTPIVPKKFDITDFLVNIVPDNGLRALVDANAMQIFCFAMFSGIVINQLGSSVSDLKNVLQQFLKLIMKMVGVIIQISPYAAFALIAYVVSVQGLSILIALSKLVLAVSMAMMFQYGIFGVLISVFAQLSPIPFYKKSIEYQALALSTSSSKVTLPTTIEVCKNKLGVSEASASFILPLGASINMDGFAINLSLTTIFFAQLMGVELTMNDYLMIVLTSTLGSIGGAGLPSASLIMLPVVLSSVNLPIEGVAILAGVDAILDRLRTAINITGDATITLIMDAREGFLDRKKYFSDDI